MASRAPEDFSVISQLQPLRFDNLTPVPCKSAGFTWEHSLPERPYPYIDGDGHDHTGRRSLVMPVTLYFLNTLQLEVGDRVLFPAAYNNYIERFLDGRAGNLEHPIAGNRRARVKNGSVALSAEVRSGVIVDVTFVETLDEPEQQVPFADVTVSSTVVAQAAQLACEEFGINYPDGEIDGLDLVSAVRSVIGQVGSTALQIEGRINQVQGAVVRMLDDAEALNDHNAYAAVDNLTLLWKSLKELKEHIPVKLQRAVGEATTQNPATLDKLARQHANDLQDIINLNPTLLENPLVPKGARYKYYLDKLEASASFVRS